MQLIGGEKSNDSEAKERKKRRRRHADEQKKKIRQYADDVSFTFFWWKLNKASERNSGRFQAPGCQEIFLFNMFPALA